MKHLKAENKRIATWIAFILIPISGLAMDIYVPSFPHMANELGVSNDLVRLTLTVFLISYGLSQLFLGSLVDSFGRYKTGLISLAIFTLSNFVIAFTHDIHLILAIRILQGMVISLIMVAKRSLFVDIYSGDQRKHYTSLLSVVWSAAPILAPFLGGYLQDIFGWRANFIFLGIYGAVMLLLEWVYGGETLQQRVPWKLQTILGNYRRFMSRKDFMPGVVILGFSYSMSIVFGMSAPFLIEHTFGYSAVVTGYCALASGIALLLGGLLSKRMIQRKMFPKLWTANLIQLLLAVMMYTSASVYASLLSMMCFVAGLHFLMGFVYNIYFTYCLTSFPENAGAAGGFTSGGGYLVTAATSYAVVSLIHIEGQQTLAGGYIIIILLITGVLALLRKLLSPIQLYRLNG
ncbi:Bcr/CflA subfamily drug resistance transporter [Chitinophaga dinghuensis]|uniref:Bcr/CflA subfamily drug resistance transporter n=1 Tax=Chitinophaga dinghuensis TaxID=1539050 RepID=A0A327VSL2_9BACT|nr:MFS transporter [Chitinophaga dinghuensis]RAJ79027.1 Bcr/CflA subfamily drug resistance transporter [Chitinophaga dinghuensis]